MASLITLVLFLITLFSLQSNSVFAQSAVDSTSSCFNLFAGDLLSFIVDQKSTENVVYSPVSIYTILALTYMGAGGRTADELRRVLKLDQKEEKRDFALKYEEFLNTTFENSIPKNKYFSPSQLSMANRIYVRKNIKISEQFNKTACHNFNSGVENVDFNYPLDVLQKINSWVEEKTSNKIKNLLQRDALDERTSMILVNAIHLKAKWLNPFKTDATEKRKFHLNHNEIVEVDTMRKTSSYLYIALPELNARAVNLKFKNSDISMLIVMPNEIDGLKQLEENLKGKDLNDIVANMAYKYLDLRLPKFRIELDIDLKDPLQKMGCSSMFGDNANLTDIFDSGISQKVSSVKHKSYIDCSEGGLEAAATTYASASFRSVGYRAPMTRFAIDRPFFFAIRSQTAIFFAGHVADFK